MRPPRPPEFLARRSYRLRRLMDAARLLPIFGLLLLLLPMLRAGSDAAAPPTAMEGVYLFAVWGGADRRGLCRVAVVAQDAGPARATHAAHRSARTRAQQFSGG